MNLNNPNPTTSRDTPVRRRGPQLSLLLLAAILVMLFGCGKEPKSTEAEAVRPEPAKTSPAIPTPPNEFTRESDNLRQSTGEYDQLGERMKDEREKGERARAAGEKLASQTEGLINLLGKVEEDVSAIHERVNSQKEIEEKIAHFSADYEARSGTQKEPKNDAQGRSRRPQVAEMTELLIELAEAKYSGNREEVINKNKARFQTETHLYSALSMLSSPNEHDPHLVLDSLPVFIQVNSASFSESNLRLVLSMLKDTDRGPLPPGAEGLLTAMRMAEDDKQDDRRREAALDTIPYFYGANKACFREGNLRVVIDLLTAQNWRVRQSSLEADSFFLLANPALATEQHLRSVLATLRDDNWYVRSTGVDVISLFLRANDKLHRRDKELFRSALAALEGEPDRRNVRGRGGLGSSLLTFRDRVEQLTDSNDLLAEPAKYFNVLASMKESHCMDGGIRGRVSTMLESMIALRSVAELDDAIKTTIFDGAVDIHNPEHLDRLLYFARYDNRIGETVFEIPGRELMESMAELFANREKRDIGMFLGSTEMDWERDKDFIFYWVYVATEAGKDGKDGLGLVKKALGIMSDDAVRGKVRLLPGGSDAFAEDKLREVRVSPSTVLGKVAGQIILRGYSRKDVMDSLEAELGMKD